MVVRKLLVGLILAATAIFSVALAFERSSRTDEGDVHALPQAPGESSAVEGPLFGMNPEARAAAAIVLIASLCVAAATWYRPNRRWLLPVTALAMSVFVFFDIREVVHQLNESNTGLGVAAMVMAALHAGSAVVALILLWKPGGSTVLLE
jgi:hypothetical protein